MVYYIVGDIGIRDSILYSIRDSMLYNMLYSSTMRWWYMMVVYGGGIR